MFWSSDILTGNQTVQAMSRKGAQFWSSDILTGNQTDKMSERYQKLIPLKMAYIPVPLEEE